MAESTHSATEAAILDANATFYRAFTDGDYAAMSELWALRAPVACLHPGARALMGRRPVLESWRQILGGASRFELRCDRPVVRCAGNAARPDFESRSSPHAWAFRELMPARPGEGTANP
jgi:SnoaL-like protein